MPDDYPKPGDTIEVTWNHPNWLGKIFVVIECPKEHRNTIGDCPSCAWFLDDSDSGNPAYFNPSSYKVVARGDGQAATGGDVDKSLKRQLNDNLKGVFT